jgi:hypothetical protein
VTAKLDKLGNRIADERPKIERALEREVPRPSASEVADYQAAQAKTTTWAATISAAIDALHQE